MSSTAWRALAAQAGALVLAALAFVATSRLQLTVAPATWLVLQAALAVMFSIRLGLPRWWLPIQAAFIPVCVLTLVLEIPPAVFLAGFLLLWALFRSNSRERVPLYLSNRTTWAALAELLPTRPDIAFVDLGCGLGGTLAHLASRFPAGRFMGVETAPLPFLISWLRTAFRPNCRIRLRSLWETDLSAFDVVYCFLSPEPMPDLWKKATREMRPDTLFVSNSFAVPGVPPDQVLTLSDTRRTRLLVWRMGRVESETGRES